MKTRMELLGMLAALTGGVERVLESWDSSRLAEAVRDVGALARETRAVLREEE